MWAALGWTVANEAQPQKCTPRERLTYPTWVIVDESSYPRNVAAQLDILRNAAVSTRQAFIWISRRAFNPFRKASRI
jgi:hypothetical protein